MLVRSGPKAVTMHLFWREKMGPCTCGLSAPAGYDALLAHKVALISRGERRILDVDIGRYAVEPDHGHVVRVAHRRVVGKVGVLEKPRPRSM